MNPNKIEFSPEIKEKIIKDYTDNQVSIVTLANRHGISFRTMKARLTEWGVKIRTMNQARKVSRYGSVSFNQCPRIKV